MSEDIVELEEPKRNGKRLRDSAAVMTAVVAVVGVNAVIAAGWFLDKVEAETAIAVLAGTGAAAANWLWVKASQKDAADNALAQPERDGSGSGG